MNLRRWHFGGLALLCLGLTLAATRPVAAQNYDRDDDPYYYQHRSEQERNRDNRDYRDYRNDNGQSRWRRSQYRHSYRSTLLPAGTPVDVTIDQAIDTRTAQVGDEWRGRVQRSVVVNGRIVIPAGTQVAGTVTDVQPATRNSRAILGLGLESMSQDGRDVSLPASMEPIVAGTQRANDIALTAGGAAAGAILGGAVSHSGKGALLGGLLGGVAGNLYGRSRNNNSQLQLKAPFTVEFTVDEPVAVDY